MPAQVETLIPTVGFDKNHRRLPFTVYVLTEQLSWRLRSSHDLEGMDTFLSPELIQAMNQASELFCVGTASIEGGTREEETRAGQRAATLGEWAQTVITHPGRPRVFVLNAGQYQGPPELVSSDQRKAIILLTGPHDSEVDLNEGLESGLESQQQNSPIVYSLLHHYSRSDLWLKEATDPR